MTSTPTTPNHLRTVTIADIPAADRIRARIGWNQTRADWQRLLQLEPEGCFLAERAGTPVGTVTTTRYGMRLGWIGMLLVDPDHRQQGLGTTLLRQAMDYLRGRGVRCIGLDATPAGKILYDGAGFQTAWTLARWETSSPLHFAPVQSSVTMIAGELWPRVVALDGQVFGLERPRLLHALAHQSSRTAVAIDGSGQITGFGMVRTGANAAMIGPLVAATPQAAHDLLAALCTDLADHRFFWDIPDPNANAVRLAKSLGFTRQRPLFRMVLGQSYPPGNPALLYAIADLATG